MSLINPSTHGSGDTIIQDLRSIVIAAGGVVDISDALSRAGSSRLTATCNIYSYYDGLRRGHASREAAAARAVPGRQRYP